MIVGKQFGPFKIEKELGSGAMGSVYSGVDDKGRRVAIKIIAPGLAANETAVERFVRESGLLKRLTHRNIARYLGSGRWRGTPFYVMEFIEGESLDRILERRVRIGWEEVAAIGVQLCAALQVAHDAGVIHRDLKPSNLMMLPDGTLKLTDFGIAKDVDAIGLTATNSTLGTAAYMSPEQCRGARDITFKSDLYSMGIVFYELLTGRKPFQSDVALQVFTMHVKGKFARPSTFVMDLPIWLDNLVCGLMEKDPDDRPASAAKVAEELASIARKVAEQASAGVERAAKRRADRTSQDRAIDADDKDAALALLGKKRKKRSTPLTQRNWFTLVGLAGVAAMLIAAAYFAFWRTPSAGGLFREVEERMAAEKLSDRKDAREPIAEFLRLHPGDPRAKQVRDWRDKIDLESTEFFIRNDRRGDDDPEDAWRALADEKAGRLDDARKRWFGLLGLKESADANLRGWGLVAEKSLAELVRVEELDKELAARVRAEKAGKGKVAEKHKADRLALEALRAEGSGEEARAWDALRRFAEDSTEDRPYYLLALKRLREIQ